MLRISSRDKRAIAYAIDRREPFKTYGSLSGERYEYSRPYLHDGHRLNDLERATFAADRGTKGIRYVILSYSTPIAWMACDGVWHIVEQSFSVTTSRHQGMIRRILHDYLLVPTDK